MVGSAVGRDFPFFNVSRQQSVNIVRVMIVQQLVNVVPSGVWSFSVGLVSSLEVGLLCVCVCVSGRGECFINTDGRQKVVSWRNRLTEELIRACSDCHSVSTLFLSYYLFHPRGFKTLHVCETISGTNRMFVEIVFRYRQIYESSDSFRLSLQVMFCLSVSAGYLCISFYLHFVTALVKT